MHQTIDIIRVRLLNYNTPYIARVGNFPFVEYNDDLVIKYFIPEKVHLYLSEIDPWKNQKSIVDFI